ncbi:MAG: glycerate kinase [Myxococcaceae bacterium]|nr:glycerate kinase [Myxococcaceae bacterium]
MRVLVAPLEFKGTLTNLAAAQAIALGLSGSLEHVELDIVPMADGGGGTVDALQPAFADAEERFTTVTHPQGKPLEARWAVCEGGKTAILEMASASGLMTLAEHERSPLDTSSRGTGELIRAALDAGCERLLLGLGGSGTHDGGVGALAVLGARFLDASGQVLVPTPRYLSRLHHVDLKGLDPRLKTISLELLCDVRNPLLGEEGATAIFAAQKGAQPHELHLLDGVFERLANAAHQSAHALSPQLEGTGAAGGMAYGLAAFAGGKLQRGFDAISAALDVFTHLAAADLVVTGEGQLDAQSAFYKGPYALGRLGHMQKKRVVTFVGAVKGSTQRVRDAFDDIVATTPPGSDADALRANAATWVTEAVRNWALRTTWTR